MMKKYKLLPAEEIVLRGVKFTAQRIQALRDIPEKNVKKGDFGGWIDCYKNKPNKRVLSHRGTCWISGDAIVSGNFEVFGNALIKDNAIVRSYLTELDGAASPGYADYKGGMIKDDTVIKDNALVAIISHSIIGGTTVIQDNAVVEIAHKASLYGKNLFAGNSQFIIDNRGDRATSVPSVWNSTIKDDARIFSGTSKDVKLDNCHFSGTFLATVDGYLREHKLNQGGFSDYTQRLYRLDILPMVAAGKQIVGDLPNRITSAPELSTGKNIYEKTFAKVLPQTDSGKNIYVEKLARVLPQTDSGKNIYVEKLARVEAKFESYQHDIVQLIKYPMMADFANPHILDFVYALQNAKDLINIGNAMEFSDAVKEAEKLFIIAEAKALVALDTKLNSEEQSKLKAASQLLSIATDENANKNEREISSKRALKEIKGILPMSNVLVDNLRISAGLKQLEA